MVSEFLVYWNQHAGPVGFRPNGNRAEQPTIMLDLYHFGHCPIQELVVHVENYWLKPLTHMKKL